MSTHSELYLDSFGLHIEPTQFSNISGPIVITASWINKQHQYILEKLLSSILNQGQRFKSLSWQRIYTIIGALERMQAILQYRSNAPAFILDCRIISPTDITMFGIDTVVSQQQRSILKSLRAHITEVLKEDRLIPYLMLSINEINNKTTMPEVIAYIYARAIRYEWLKIYDQQYPQMKLLDNLGVATKQHVLALSMCSHLPPFYIWDKTIRAIQKDKIAQKVIENIGSTHWLHKELATVNHKLFVGF